MAKDSVSTSVSSCMAGIFPDGLMARYSGVRLLPSRVLMGFQSKSSPISSATQRQREAREPMLPKIVTAISFPAMVSLRAS
jgi:hypothetical protein